MHSGLELVEARKDHAGVHTTQAVRDRERDRSDANPCGLLHKLSEGSHDCEAVFGVRRQSDGRDARRDVRKRSDGVDGAYSKLAEIRLCAGEQIAGMHERPVVDVSTSFP
eukprot:scaffold1661_cov251-Pinguiococcus_pyrenoidosus.AAC.18